MTLCIDLFGGAITDFHLDQYDVNPLSFKFSPDQMPSNNQGGAVYQGHFLCLGRWGHPSPGEINAGIPSHGEIANIMWEESRHDNDSLDMKAAGNLEGLSVHRSVRSDTSNPVYLSSETVTNIHPLGRMYNMVQHPTIANPFLDEHVLVDCNAGKGFDYAFDEFMPATFQEWPIVFCQNSQRLNIRSCNEPYSSVFSFVVNPGKTYGWITAASPSQKLLIGYIWKRIDYPWINHWINWSDNTIVYRGLEFGTTGIHKPFNEILQRKLIEVLDEKTYSYLDAGESHTRSFISFLQPIAGNYNGVANVDLHNNQIQVTEKNTGQQINISTFLKLSS